MFRRGLFYAFLSIYLRYFLHLSVTETTLFATLPMIANITAQMFIWGPISDRFQVRRRLIVTGEILAGFGTLIVWYAHRISPTPAAAGFAIILGLTVVEVFWSMSNVGWSALIADLYPEQRRTDIQGKLASIGGLGRIGGVWIGGLLYDGLGFRYAGWGFHQGALFFVATAAMFVSVIPMRWVPEGGVRHVRQGGDPDPVNAPAHNSAIFAVFLTAMVFINFGRNSIAIILPQYLVLKDGFAVSSAVLSYIVNTQSVAMILSGFVAGRIGRRIGDGNALLLGALLAIIALLILTLTDHLSLVYLAGFLRGVSDVILMAASYTYAATLMPSEKRARLFGVFNATFFLSWGVAGTLVAGPITDSLLAAGAGEGVAYRTAFLAAAGITVLGGGIQFALDRYISRQTAIAAKHPEPEERVWIQHP